MTQSGQTATIRFAKYRTKGEDSTLNFIDLSFDGTTYSVTRKDEENKQYQYLNHYTIEAGSDADFSTLDVYILVNEKDVTYDELEKSMASSNSNDYIDNYFIYVNILK